MNDNENRDPICDLLYSFRKFSKEINKNLTKNREYLKELEKKIDSIEIEFTDSLIRNFTEIENELKAEKKSKLRYIKNYIYSLLDLEECLENSMDNICYVLQENTNELEE